MVLYGAFVDEDLLQNEYYKTIYCQSCQVWGVRRYSRLTKNLKSDDQKTIYGGNVTVDCKNSGEALNRLNAIIPTFDPFIDFWVVCGHCIAQNGLYTFLETEDEFRLLFEIARTHTKKPLIYQDGNTHLKSSYKWDAILTNAEYLNKKGFLDAISLTFSFDAVLDDFDFLPIINLIQRIKAIGLKIHFLDISIINNTVTTISLIRQQQYYRKLKDIAIQYHLECFLLTDIVDTSNNNGGIYDTNFRRKF